ncbi:uncharacterized protein LOC122573946 isoform X1 [Bombus pyrosoma]|uniref:uncharacterized protein LOC122573946 isoform X1 n=1 Tax=Bombus pyrosoma TaxID=396416 RepID=UPI001CB89D20|nr:uncharacterized protein LOC122573946 isoform X1 [Bombus pyrosoma]
MDSEITKKVYLNDCVLRPIYKFEIRRMYSVALLLSKKKLKNKNSVSVVSSLLTDVAQNGKGNKNRCGRVPSWPRLELLYQFSKLYRRLCTYTSTRFIFQLERESRLR